MILMVLRMIVNGTIKAIDVADMEVVTGTRIPQRKLAVAVAVVTLRVTDHVQTTHLRGMTLMVQGIIVIGMDPILCIVTGMVVDMRTWATLLMKHAVHVRVDVLGVSIVVKRLLHPRGDQIRPIHPRLRNRSRKKRK